MRNFAELEKIAQQAGVFPLREPQVRALRGVVAGRNLLIVWPTGSGKSLCFQLPSQAGEGLTLVVSPLIALMEDQVAKGRALGWSTTCIHSGVRREQRESRLEAVRAGRVKLLYVTPERFRQPGFLELVATAKVRLFAVDEAHCISQWGHDFRPDYSRLGEIREALGRPQTLALTATATSEVQKDILRQLHLAPETEILWEGVERPNLHLAAEECGDLEEKTARALKWLNDTSGPKIIYFTLIASLEKFAARLRGRNFAVYHGDLEPGARQRHQSRFLAGEEDLMLATPAFGLGIDKPDIRGILHFETPGSLEAYYQEVGRAGRDGGKSFCLWLYDEEDLETQMRFIDAQTPDPSYVRAVYQLLQQWKDRLTTASLDDLRAQLSFKNKRDYRLETALNLLERLDVLRWPHRQLKKLEFLNPLQDDDLSEELWKTRRLELQKKLLALVQWRRNPECRKVGIYRYFGWPNEEPCGFCDHCEAAR